MEQQLRDFVQYLVNIENYKEIKSLIAKKRTTVKEAATVIHHDTTLLLSELLNVTKFAVLISLLSAQLESLPESAHMSFRNIAIVAFQSSDDGYIAQHFHAEVAAVAHFAAQKSCLADDAASIVAPLLHICKQVSRKPSELTSIHSDVLQVMISAKHYSAALEFLSTCSDITEIDPSYTSLDTRHFLSYCYYAGLVYISHDRFDDALAVFDLAIATPAVAVSAIVVQSYKAAMLVSLIAHGNEYIPPESASTCIRRMNTQPYLAIYVTISHTFMSSDINSLLSSIHTNSSFLESDHFYGLAVQTVAALRRKKLRQLSCTYRTLALTEIMRVLQLENVAETCRCVEKLVVSGLIYAGIDEISGIVTFKEATDAPHHLHTSLLQLRMKLAHTNGVAERLRLMQSEIFTSQAYLVKSLTSASAGADSSVLRGVMDEYDYMDYDADEKC